MACSLCCPAPRSPTHGSTRSTGSNNITPGQQSIVCASITDAARGEYGDHHFLARTRAKGTELFINPLMSMVWGFDLDAVADRVLYRHDIAYTTTPFEVAAAIEAFRDHIPLRPRRTIPA